VTRSRFRSVRYDLAAAVEVARMVDSAGGALAADILAPALGYSGTNNGTYLTRVANARLFGVVTGRGSRFEITDRGRRILAGVEPGASSARQEAFLAVPLFRAVVDTVAQNGGLLPDHLAPWLEADFGELDTKSQAVADRMIASASQAGLLRTTDGGKYQLGGPLTNFTPVEKPAFPRIIRQLGFARNTRSPLKEDVAVAESGLWLDDEPKRAPKQRPLWRRVGVVAAAAVVLVVVAVPVALVAGGSPSQPTASHKTAQHPHLGDGPAEHQVLSALSATTDSGNFDFSYAISTAPPPGSVPTVTPTTTCNEVKVPVPGPSIRSTSEGSITPMPVVVGGTGEKTSGSVGYANGTISSSSGGGSLSAGNASASASKGSVSAPTTAKLPPGFEWKTQKVCSGPPEASNPLVQGGGVINTNPLGMVASANIGNGLDVSVRVDGTDVYEGASNDTGLAPQASDASASGTSLPGFASITESTLGEREGAVAMMGMASPTGYLDLIQPAISAAAKTGTGTVDGTPVTIYQISNNLDQLASAAGTTGAESQTITAALTLLKTQGYTSNSVVVSIDNAGYIRQVKSTDTFTDGSSVTLQATFSNFGCAGTVLMPGQSGSDTPPTGCTSPDGPTSSPKTTTPKASASTRNTTGTTIGSGVPPTTSTTLTTSTAIPTVKSIPPESPPSTVATTVVTTTTTTTLAGNSSTTAKS
jgi:hypothetical protein